MAWSVILLEQPTCGILGKTSSPAKSSVSHVEIRFAELSIVALELILILETYFAALAVFVVAFLVGYAVSARPRIAFSVITFAAIVIGALGFLVQWARQGGGDFGPAFSAVMIFTPMFLIGLGFFAAVLVRRHEGKLAKQSAIVALCVVPVGVWAYWTDSNERAKELELTRFKSKMELTDIGGTFGSHNVTIPVSPLISVATNCTPPAGSSDGICHGDFSGSGFRMDLFHGYGSTDLEFDFISVSFPKCEGISCATVSNWCERRPELLDTVWCQSQSEFRLEMSKEPAGPKGQPKNPLPLKADTVDGLSVRCSDVYSGKRYCTAYLEVAQGIWGQFSINDIEQGNEEELILEKAIEVQRVWDQLTLE